MKLKKSNLFYLFVLLLSISVYYFDYYKVEKDQQTKDKAAILIPFLTDEISQIELKNASGDLELIKKDSHWILKKPVEDLAASDEITGWIQTLTTEKSTEKIGEGEVFDWSTYGLDKPKANLIVTSTSGKKIQLQIAERKSFEGNSFIKKDNEKNVYVASAVWASLMEKSIKELRDKRILREPLKELEEVVIAKGNQSTHFLLKEGKWIIKDKPTWHLDQNKVREIINLSQDIKTSEFVLETEPNKTQLEAFGFSANSIKVTYYLKGVKSFVFEFAQDKSKKWYAWPYDLKRLVKIEDASINKVAQLNLMDLRDRELPFIFNKDEVKKLNIISDKKMELSKEGEAWKATGSGAVEQTEVNDFLEKLRQLRVAEFMDGKDTAPGIDAEKKRFILADAKGKSLFDLKIGNSFKKKEDKTEKNFVYAKSSIYPDVIVLKEEDLATLTSDKLVKVEKKSDSTKVDAKPGSEAQGELKNKSHDKQTEPIPETKKQ